MRLFLLHGSRICLAVAVALATVGGYLAIESGSRPNSLLIELPNREMGETVIGQSATTIRVMNPSDEPYRVMVPSYG